MWHRTNKKATLSDRPLFRPLPPPQASFALSRHTPCTHCRVNLIGDGTRGGHCRSHKGKEVVQHQRSGQSSSCLWRRCHVTGVVKEKRPQRPGETKKEERERERRGR